jgi:hypothetical protein
MKQEKKRRLRTYKVADEPYDKAMKTAKKKKKFLASEIEKFIEQYSELYDYITR